MIMPDSTKPWAVPRGPVKPLRLDVCALMAEAGPRYNLTPLEEQALSRFYEREDAHP